jgi:predicted aspartyl protease
VRITTRLAEVDAMTRHFQIATLWSFVLIVVSCVAQQQMDGRASSDGTDSDTSPVEIPIRLYRDYLVVVQGSLGDAATLNLLIDTGASPSVLDQRLAQRLALHGVPGKLGLVDHTVSVEQVVLPSLRVGPLLAESLPVLVRDLTFLKKGLGTRIDGVIGLDVLRLRSFSLNYKSKKIVFGPPTELAASVPFETPPPFIAVEMQIGGAPMRVLIDTGSSGLMLFHTRIRSRIRGVEIVGERRSSNMGGDFRRQQVVLPTINLGAGNFTHQTGFVVDDQVDGGREFDGLLGPAALGMTQVAFDFQHGVFWWKK